MVEEFTIIDNLTLSTSDRISIFGRTGSGKTFFASNYLLPHYESYIFWDVKGENADKLQYEVVVDGEIKQYKMYEVIVDGPDDLKRAITQYKKILYQPADPTDADFNAVCETIFRTGNTALYIDEAAAVTMPGKIQYWHKMIITQGRSRKAGIINVSQRPRDIHNTLISESEHIFVFTLSLETDILKLRQQMGDAADEIRYLPEYHFLYYSVRTNRSFIFKPVRLLGIRTEPDKKPEIPKLERYMPKLEDYISLRAQRET